jgi:hypothetical protein
VKLTCASVALVSSQKLLMASSRSAMMKSIVGWRQPLLEVGERAGDLDRKDGVSVKWEQNVLLLSRV